jgi:tRNA threonylcarbamoyladenosine biosynthesis protein TsaB
MLVLAIETSGPVGSVALLNGREILTDQALELGRKHAQSLIPTIQQLLVSHGKQPAEVGLVAVSVGPGSYTGLRVGVVCAKTFAYALACPLTAVDTLQAIAVNSPAGIERIEVVADAQRGDLFSGRYQRSEPGNWERIGDVQVLSAEEWASRLAAGDTVSGPGLEKYGDLALGKCRALPVDFWVPTASNIARLGIRLLAIGETADPGNVEPLYLRRSSAEVQWERLHPAQP